MMHFKSVGKRVSISWGFYKRYFNKLFYDFYLLSWILFQFLILGKALLSNSQICCSDFIHKDVFKIINAFNVFSTCGYFVLFFLIFYITLFVFICFSKGAFSPQRPALCFIRLYIISVIILFSVCVVSWFYLFSYFSSVCKVEMLGSHDCEFTYYCF